MIRPRLGSRRALGLASAAILLTAGAAWPHGTTYHDINYQIFTGCSSCHNASSLDTTLTPSAEEVGWYDKIVRKPSGDHGGVKLLVHPSQPWNSLLIDKLLGDVKADEGVPMPKGGPGYVFACPGAIDEIYNWILEHATTEVNHWVAGDTEPYYVQCDKPQPALVPPLRPSGGYQVTGPTFEVRRPAREAEKVTTVSVGNAVEAFVNRLEIAASAGTEYVTVSRKGDDAPLAVARGQVDPHKPRFQPGLPQGPNPLRLVITLPEGVGIKLAPNQQLEIRQVVRNDFWLPPGTPENPSEYYANVTRGEVTINLFPVAASEVSSEAVPFMDASGGDLLLVPPKAIRTTGGAWTAPSSVAGALVGLWTDSRVLQTAVSNGAGAPIAGADITRGYAAAGAAPAIVYSCTHGNGATEYQGSATSQAIELELLRLSDTVGPQLATPVRYGCSANANVAAGAPASSSQACYRATDCKDASAALCAPANLVGGPGVEDGRCALVGLYW
jgi:hypothetical protein